MHAAKVLVLVVIGGVVLASGVFAFFPSTRPGIVKKWFHQARGFTPANSPEDALDKFKQAMEKRDYEAAKLYVTGDYLEFLTKGANDATELVRAADELKDVMKTTGVKSDKVDFMLFKFDPFPPFKVSDVKKSSASATAVLNWDNDVARFRNVNTAVSEYKVNMLMLHSLMPTALLQRWTVTVKDTGAGGWKIEFPVQVGDRHLRDTVEALRKNATNYRNAMRDIKQSIKNNPAVKEDFERQFKTALEKSN
jgi:hypothetical protein